MSVRYCIRCGETKELSCFWKAYNRCRKCVKEEKALHYAANRERYILQQAKYRSANPDVYRIWAEKNKDKRLVQRRERYALNPEKHRLKALCDIAKKEGYAPPDITPEELRTFLQFHAGVCDFQGCGKAGEHLDHCHKTGKVRGFLCVAHNHLLGCAHDSIDELQDAIDYLRRADG